MEKNLVENVDFKQLCNVEEFFIELEKEVKEKGLYGISLREKKKIYVNQLNLITTFYKVYK